MKKNIFVVAILLSTIAFAQENELKLGIKVFPGLAWSRIEPASWQENSTNTYTYEANPAQFRGGFGVFGDYYLKDNYALCIGVNYLFNSSGYNVHSTNLSVNEHNVYSIQYIQVPFTLKLISNELIDNLKVYSNFGLAGNVLTGTTINGKSSIQPVGGGAVRKYTADITNLALDFVVAAGIEYELNGGMKLLAGLTYMHGILDVNARKDNFYNSNTSGFAFKNSLLAVEIGLKF